MKTALQTSIQQRSLVLVELNDATENLVALIFITCGHAASHLYNLLFEIRFNLNLYNHLLEVSSILDMLLLIGRSRS